MRAVLSVVTAIVAGFAGQAFAADEAKLLAKYPAWGDPKVVAFYDAKCDADSAAECVVFDIGCDDKLSMRLTAVDVSEPTLALARDGKASMELYGDMIYRLRADHAELNGLSGGWNLTLRIEDIALEDFADATSMALNYGHKFSVPLTPETRAAFAAAAQACGYRPAH